MGDFLNPVYDVVTPTTTNNSESDTKCGGKKPVPTPAPRPSILRKKSLPSPGKLTIDSQVSPIAEENFGSLGSGSNQTQNDEPFYEEPVKHFPPPSYPPPKPPRKSSDNHEDEDELTTIKDQLINKINEADFSDDDDGKVSVFKARKSNEINQNHLILQVPAPGIVVNVINHVYVNNTPGQPLEPARSSLESGSSLVPSPPPPPLPPRKASLDSSHSQKSCHSISDHTPNNPNITQDERLFLALSRTDSLQSDKPSPRPFQRSVTVPIEIPGGQRTSGSMESTTSSSQHSDISNSNVSNSNIPTFQVRFLPPKPRIEVLVQQLSMIFLDVQQQSMDTCTNLDQTGKRC